MIFVIFFALLFIFNTLMYTVFNWAFSLGLDISQLLGFAFVVSIFTEIVISIVISIKRRRNKE